MSISQVQGACCPVHIWAPVHEVESEALQQLKNIASLPWVFKHVAAMPDVHYGIGATVGSVIAMRGAVAPAAVGVDIGCGMAAVKTSLTASDLPDSLNNVRSVIEAAVPVNHNGHSTMARGAKNYEQLWSQFQDLHPAVGGDSAMLSKAQAQCGTLGGGNHFIELCLDTEQNVWIMLHSGSRNVGKVLAELHIARARKLAHNAELPDKDLAVFLAGTTEMQEYVRDLKWAQRYAYANRQTMLDLVMQVVLTTIKPCFEVLQTVICHHNYLSEENHFGEDVLVTRKGAIRAQNGEYGIIPGSMGTRSYIVRGLGNAESFCSASHGAGRRMSRGKAKKAFTVDDLARATEGVECRKDAGVLDEIPGAYKDIDQVMANQSDLVEIVAELKQILCVKG